MRPALRKAILFTVLLGIVGLLVLDSGDEAVQKRRISPANTAPGEGKAARERSRETGPDKSPGRYVLPERPALGAPQAQLFGPQSWQPKVDPRAASAAKPAAPRVPAMPYRYAGKLLHEGRLKVFLAKGDDEVFPVRAGETLDGAYRVQSIDDSRITLLYLPLGRTQTIPVDSALPLAGPQPAAGAAKPRAAAPAGKAAQVLWEGPKRVKLGAKFSIALHVTSSEPVAASPMQFKFDPRLLESVSVQPGRFFEQNRDKFSFRVSPEGSIFIGAANRDLAPATDAEFLVLTFKPIKPAAVAELSIASLSLQGSAGRAIAFESPAAFRTAITP